jgi:tRNA wybutosine-synthesizing protein 1
MESKEIINQMKKQGYRFVGDHAAVKICRWTKKSMKNQGVCYKEKFYGIKSHLCCQMTPWLGCPNSCVHCWRAIELDFNKLINRDKIKTPKEIIAGCIKAQRKLLLGYKNHKVTNMKKYNEAQEPMQFAISLSGEPTVYEKLGDLIEELRKKGKTSFLVTNGLYPEKIKEIAKKKQLPTQLYVSVNTPNKELYIKFHRSSKKDAWERLNETLNLMSGLGCRTVFRMNLVRDLNMAEGYIREYAKLIKKAKPRFIEVKGFMSVGFARQRLGYERMPTDKEMLNFVKKLAKETGLKLLDKHDFSRAYVLGKDKKDLKIKKSEV